MTVSKWFSTALVVAISVLATHSNATAEIVLSSAGVPVVETFNSYRGLGFSATPSEGQLDSTTYRAIGFSDGDGTFGGEFLGGDFARGSSTGGVTTGGAYAFQVGDGDYALGVQPTDDDFTPGTLTIAIRNETGARLSTVNVMADALVYNDEPRSTLWTFEGSLDDSTYFPFFTLQSPLAADPTPSWNPEQVGGPISLGSGVADGGTFFVRVSGVDAGGLGGRDEFALNNLSVTAITAIPEPTSVLALATLFGALFATRRRRPR